MIADRTIDVIGGGIGDGRQIETWQLIDGLSQLGVCDCQRSFLLIFERVEKLREKW